MHIIDVALKETPSLLSVQRKESADAEALYNTLISALQSGSPTTMELTCEKEVGKKVCVLVSAIAAVQLSEKTGVGGSSGRPPGFFALTQG
ncbi:MAG: hypothetical protein KME20_09340 [Kaiparowitsia implicata GSE-PSE-MK54-09C]|jgi:hypothetical protein|nr:hypothetical protein [Kaiparowitsia implicata GSE-PSE-MK54-09C]